MVVLFRESQHERFRSANCRLFVNSAKLEVNSRSAYVLVPVLHSFADNTGVYDHLLTCTMIVIATTCCHMFLLVYSIPTPVY